MREKKEPTTNRNVRAHTVTIVDKLLWWGVAIYSNLFILTIRRCCFFFVLLFVYLFASWLAGLLAYMQCSVKAKCEVILSFFLSLPFFHRSMCTHNIRIVLFCLLARFFFVPADVSQGFPIASISFSIPETQ